MNPLVATGATDGAERPTDLMTALVPRLAGPFASKPRCACRE
jgi:hypothetical protein